MARLSPQSAQDVECTIGHLEGATSVSQANNFATWCLTQMAKDKTFKVNEIDSVQNLVDELIRQKRVDDANKISSRYFELVAAESTN